MPAIAGGKLLPGALVEVIGNSISIARDYSAGARVANALAAVEVNHSIGGMVHCWDDASGSPGGYATCRQRLVRFNKQSSGLTYGAESDLVIIASPQNDLHRLAATNNRAVLKHGIRSMISHALVATAYEETDPALTFTGTWATQANPGPPQAQHGTGADSAGAGYKYSSTQGDSFQIKIPGDYPGSARCPLSIAFVGFPTAVAATALLTASGAATGTFSLDTALVCDYTNSRRNGVVWRFTGNAIAPSNGVPQTLTITLTTITNAQRVAVDYVGFETDLQTGQPRVIVLSTYKMNPFNSVFGSVTAADIANFNADLQSVIAEFGASVQYLDMDALFGGIGVGNTTTLNGAHDAVTTTITVGSTTGFPAAGTIFCGNELIKYTGKTGTTFTGCTRGAWATAAGPHSNGDQVRDVNEVAIPNFIADGIHWSEDGQRKVANAILGLVAPGAPADTAGRRGSGGRNTASACKKFVTYDMIFGSSELKIPFDRERYDMGSWHTPSGITIGQPYDQHEFVCPADGQHSVIFNYAWNPNSPSTAGWRQVTLKRIPIDGSGTQVLVMDGCSLNGAGPFSTPGRSLSWIGDLRRGDIVFLTGQGDNGIGQGTTLTGAHSNSATTLTVASTAGMTNGQKIRIDNEVITIGTVASGTLLTGCTRGTSGTLAVGHSGGATVAGGLQFLPPSSTNRERCELTITRLGPLVGST